MSIKLYNTMSRTQEEFKSIEDGKVSMYCCGPTVYNYAHIGNLRTYIFEDLLHRTLEHAGYKVDHVMNITDVGHLTGDGDDGEDKISKRAKETGKSVCWRAFRPLRRPLTAHSKTAAMSAGRGRATFR